MAHVLLTYRYKCWEKITFRAVLFLEMSRFESEKYKKQGEQRKYYDVNVNKTSENAILTDA